MPKKKRGSGFGKAAAQAAKKLVPEGRVAEMVGRFTRGEEPQEWRQCTFCGKCQGGTRYGSENARLIRFIQCLDTDSSAASTFYFPGQSRDTPKDALVRGRLGPTLKRQYLATPSWSCMPCADTNRAALGSFLTQLKAGGRAEALRRVIAADASPPGSAARAAPLHALQQLPIVVGQQQLEDARRYAHAGIDREAYAVLLHSEPWEGMRHVTRPREARVWELSEPRSFTRVVLAQVREGTGELSVNGMQEAHYCYTYGAEGEVVAQWKNMPVCWYTMLELGGAIAEQVLLNECSPAKTLSGLKERARRLIDLAEVRCLRPAAVQALLACRAEFEGTHHWARLELRRLGEAHRKTLANSKARRRQSRETIAQLREENDEMLQDTAEIKTLRQQAKDSSRTIRRLERSLGQGRVEDEEHASVGSQTDSRHADFRLESRHSVPLKMRDLVVKLAVSRLVSFRQVFPAARDAQVAMQLEDATSAAQASDGHDTAVRCIKEVGFMCFMQMCLEMAQRKGFVLEDSAEEEEEPAPHPMCWKSPWAQTDGLPPKQEPTWTEGDAPAVRMAEDYAAMRTKAGEPIDEEGGELDGALEAAIRERRAALDALQPNGDGTAKPEWVEGAGEDWYPENDESDIGAVVAVYHPLPQGIQCNFCKTCDSSSLPKPDAEGGWVRGHSRCRCKGAWFVSQVVNYDKDDGLELFVTDSRYVPTQRPAEEGDDAGEEDDPRLWSPVDGRLSADVDAGEVVYLGEAPTMASIEARIRALEGADDEPDPEMPELYEPDMLGLDAVGFYDEASFLNMFVYGMQEDLDPDERRAFIRRQAFAWLSRNVTSHGPAGDLQKVLEFFEIVRAVQHRIGVPAKQWAYVSDLLYLLGDNEAANTGKHRGLIVQLNNYKRRELNWRHKHHLVAKTQSFVPIQFNPCHLHILNRGDVKGSELWRAHDHEKGDPFLRDEYRQSHAGAVDQEAEDEAAEIVIGGKDSKEGLIQFFARFFSRTFRNHVGWRSYCVLHYDDTELVDRAIRSRFWKRLAVACYLYDRIDWLFGDDGFWAMCRDAEKAKQSAAAVLLEHMHRHRRLLESDCAVCRVVRDWAHSEIGHSAATHGGEGNAKKHLGLLKKKIAEIKAMGAETAEGDAALDAMWSQYLGRANALKAAKMSRLRKGLERRRQSQRMDLDGDEEEAADAAASKPGLDFGADDDPGLDFEQLTALYTSRVEPPTEHQRHRVRCYLGAIAQKFEEFAGGQLQEDTEELKELLFDTFDIERGNAVLKILHDRNTLTASSTYREFLRLFTMAAAFPESPSGAAYGYGDLPPVLRKSARLRRLHIRWVRTVEDLEPSSRQWRLEQAESYQAVTEARTASVLRTRAERVRRDARIRDRDGGYVHRDVERRDAPCPRDFLGRERLDGLLDALYDSERFGGMGGDDSDSDDDEAMLSYTEVAERLEAEGDAEMLDLTAILKDIFAKQVQFADDTYEVISFDDWFGELEDDLADKHIDQATLAASLEPLPEPCDECQAGRSCRWRKLPAHERLELDMIDKITLKHTTGWSAPTVADWILKRDLLAAERTAAEFRCLRAAGVWGTDEGEWPEEPTTRIAARPESAPSFSALKEPQLHELLRCVLRGEQEYRRTCPAAEDAASWARRLAEVGSADAETEGGDARPAELPEEPSYGQLAGASR